MPADNGGGDLTLVTLDQFGKPSCRLHGAMNKVAPAPANYWRCITTSSAKSNPCRAACAEPVVALMSPSEES